MTKSKPALLDFTNSSFAYNDAKLLFVLSKIIIIMLFDSSIYLNMIQSF